MYISHKCIIYINIYINVRYHDSNVQCALKNVNNTLVVFSESYNMFSIFNTILSKVAYFYSGDGYVSSGKTTFGE